MTEIALDLDPNGIRLLSRSGEAWTRHATVRLNAPDFTDRMRRLRDAAAALTGGSLAVTVVIPPSQILYMGLSVAGTLTAETVRRALDGRTSCPAEDLVFDWRVTGDRALVAAIDRRTLTEAEAFLRKHGFTATGHTAEPEPDEFPDRPDFGMAPGSRPAATPAPAAEISPLPPARSVADAPAGRVPEPVAERAGPVPRRGSKADTGPAVEAAAQPLARRAETAGAGTVAAGPGAAAAGLAEAPAPFAGPPPEMAVAAAPPATARPGPLPGEQPCRPKGPTGTSIAAPTPRSGDEPPLSQAQPIVPGLPDPARLGRSLAPRRPARLPDPVGTAPLDPPARTPVVPPRRPAPPPSRDRQRAGRRRIWIGLGGGLAVTAALVWVALSLVSPDRLFRQVAAPEPGELAAPPPTPELPAAPTAVALGGTAQPAPRPGNPEPRPAAVLARPVDPPGVTEVAARAAAAGFVPGALPTADPAPAILRATDIRQTEPVPPIPPLSAGATGLHLAAIAPVTIEGAGQARPAAPAAIPSPPVAETLSPSRAAAEDSPPPAQAERTGPAIPVTEGPPPVVPPARPAGLAPQAEAVAAAGTEPAIVIPVTEAPPPVVPPTRPAGLAPQTPTQGDGPEGAIATQAAPPPAGPSPQPGDRASRTAATASQSDAQEPAEGGDPAMAIPVTEAPPAVVPPVRPGDLAGRATRIRLARTLGEAAARRPAARPGSTAGPAGALPEVASALAVASAPEPRLRPEEFSDAVAAARRRDTGTTAVPTTPTLPSSASVARQATVENAIRLNRVNLIGVFGSSANRRALIRLPSGRLIKVKVGDRFDGGRIAAIGDNELSYIKGGRSHTLKVPSS